MCEITQEMPTQQAKTVAVVFARRDSIYKLLSQCDVYDADRDARTFPGGLPVVAHPPCRAWGRLRHFAKPRADEKDLAIWAIEQVRKWGGVLEHPRASTLWPAADLPAPGRNPDKHGGWTLGLNQHWFGHRAEKATLLYICGVNARCLPPLPFRIDEPTHVVSTTRGKRPKPEVSKAEREHTPKAFAEWLCLVATLAAKRAA